MVVVSAVGPTGFDVGLLDAIVAHRVGWISAVCLAVGKVGTSVAGLALIGLIALAIAARLRAWRPLIAAVAASAVADVVVGVLKDLLERPRPAEALTLLPGVGYAFPSTHAAFTSAACVALVVAAGWRGRARRAAAVALGLGCAVVGAMMVYLGSHWATDVLVGWAIGVVIGVASGRLLRTPTGTEPAARADPAPRRAHRDAPSHPDRP